MKKLIVSTLLISVISMACKKKSSDNPITSSAASTNTTTPTTNTTTPANGNTVTDSSKVTATVGSYSFISLNNYGVYRVENQSTGQTKTWSIVAFVDTGSVNNNLPRIQFQFKKNHLAGGTFPISASNFTNDSVVASYRINGVFYNASSGTITITKMDTVADAYGQIANLKATFSFQTKINTTTNQPYILTNGVVKVFPL